MPNEFVRASGDGWWSTERVGEDGAEPFLDLSILRDPNFVAALAGLLVAQAIAGWFILRQIRDEEKDKDA